MAYPRWITRARFGARVCGGIPDLHGFTPVATHLDRFAVRMGGVFDVVRTDCGVAPPCYGYSPGLG